MKIVLILGTLFTLLNATNIKVYQYTGVEVKYEGEKITLEREIDPKCLNISISSENVWEGAYANEEIPKECKATFVTSVGQIQPISMHPEIETYGEMEVMHFFKKMQSDNALLLVDCRAEHWFDYRTIPGAINAPHEYITDAKSFPEDFKKTLLMFGVKEINGSYDFTQVKTLTLFCNGAWCSQSVKMITTLMSLGYPSNKLKWYRGGMHDWLTLSMTSTHKIEE